MSSAKQANNSGGEAGLLPDCVDSRQVRRGFARAAPHYEENAFVEREIGRRMLERLDYVRVAPRHIVDLGCGPGTAVPALRERYPKAHILGVDSSVAMLRAGQARSRSLSWLLPFLKPMRWQRVCADAQALPIGSGLAQLLWSNLLLLWCRDPAAVLREMHRVLDVDGLLMFTTFGPDTLKELRAAFGDGAARTQRFVDMHDLGDMLVETGFSDPVMEMEVLTVTYADVDALLSALRASGATCAASDRPRGLAGKGVWRKMRMACASLHRDGRLPVTLEIIYGHAWKQAPMPEAGERSSQRALIRFDRSSRK